MQKCQKEIRWARQYKKKIIVVSMTKRPRLATSTTTGHWDCYISHDQATGGVQSLTTQLRLSAASSTVWYYQNMDATTEAAMEEGVKHSRCVVLFHRVLG